MEYFSLVHLLSTQNLIMFTGSLHNISCNCENIYFNEIMYKFAEISQHVVHKRMKTYTHASEKGCTQHVVAQWSPRGGSQC